MTRSRTVYLKVSKASILFGGIEIFRSDLGNAGMESLLLPSAHPYCMQGLDLDRAEVRNSLGDTKITLTLSNPKIHASNQFDIKIVMFSAECFKFFSGSNYYYYLNK